MSREAVAGSAPASSVRDVLVRAADEVLDNARRDARELLQELERGGDIDVIDGLLLDIRWALGERRGYCNALASLIDAGLVDGLLGDDGASDVEDEGAA